MDFNQKLLIPSFIDEAAKTNETVDVSSFLSIKYAIKSDIEPEKIQFHLKFIEWSPDNMKFQIFFDEPLLVSNG